MVAVLTEQKLLIHSLQPDVLTSIGEALVSVSVRCSEAGRQGRGEDMGVWEPRECREKLGRVPVQLSLAVR